MKFHYQAKQRNGAATMGELDATSLGEARSQLRAKGLFVTSLSSDKLVDTADQPKAQRGIFQRVSRADLVMMLSQLTIMCQSGVDLAEALQSVARQFPKAALKSVLLQVHGDVSSGCSFSESLARHPHVFDNLFVASIAAGEQSGSINQVLERLTYLVRSDMRLHSTVWSMLMYPLVLAGVTTIVLNALVFFVLPQFATVFETLEKPVPALTQFLLHLGTVLQTHAVVIFGGLFAVLLGAYRLRHATAVRRVWDYATLRLAVVRNVTQALLAGRTFRLLGTMLMSGVPLVEGLRLCCSATKNQLYRELFEQVERDVLNGAGLAGPLLTSQFLPSGAAQMVVTAERSGRMGEVLKNVGEYYEDEGERALRDLIKIAEPAVIMVLGLVVAGIVLSIIVPMLDVSTMSH